MFGLRWYRWARCLSHPAIPAFDALISSSPPKDTRPWAWRTSLGGCGQLRYLLRDRANLLLRLNINMAWASAMCCSAWVQIAYRAVMQIRMETQRDKRKLRLLCLGFLLTPWVYHLYRGAVVAALLHGDAGLSLFSQLTGSHSTCSPILLPHSGAACW